MKKTVSELVNRAEPVLQDLTLYIKIIHHLNDLREYQHYFIEEQTINDAEATFIHAFRTREQDDIDAFYSHLEALYQQASKSRLLANIMTGLMIGSVLLSFACIPVILPSYLNLLSVPMWIEVLAMSMFSATTMVYLGGQYVQSQAIGAGKLSLFHQDTAEAVEQLTPMKDSDVDLTI